MHNILAAELMKLKKNKMAGTGTLLLCAIPVLAMIKKILIDKDSIGLQEWYLTIFLLQTIALPVVNGFVLTSLIQREYQDCTLRNTLCAPVSRSAFLLSKTVIWFLWFFLSASAAMLLTISGARLLFPSGFGTDELLLIAGQLTQQALLVFLTSLPALWIAVSQRAAFYPALLAVLGFAILETAGMQVSVEWLLPASLCPWTAVSVSVLVEKGGGFCSRSKFLSKILKILVKNFPEIFPEFFFYSFANFNEKNSNLIALNDGGAIKGMDAREDGVYITYVPTAGADAVTKKM